ncbi:cell division protein FtsL [Legionella cincinnatiensis]|uniref:Cell division protein FtsL n=1 Tax=Legionella cincinnatiensis TaxID=28085 RepID=A0A378IMX1_9GAMM|nr:cell division protein FtsL [Legionella cincinnatiensis]KTC88496.1 cell division transmembrane protein FtsL [Legionella cincinnatiensis]STX36015.1 cell division transmembrane protein FtsL [Legionella cincinnatiensis]
MNAAAKVINQEGTLFNGQLADIHMSKSLYMLVILLIAVLVSALAVVYSTNSYRVTLNQVEQQEQLTHYLQLQWGQLLLEQASLATPARVEELAHEKLQMVLPNSKNTYWLQAQQ